MACLVAQVHKKYITAYEKEMLLGVMIPLAGDHYAGTRNIPIRPAALNFPDFGIISQTVEQKME